MGIQRREQFSFHPGTPTRYRLLNWSHKVARTVSVFTSVSIPLLIITALCWSLAIGDVLFISQVEIAGLKNRLYHFVRLPCLDLPITIHRGERQVTIVWLH